MLRLSAWTALAIALALPACKGGGDADAGSISIDGSSTVFPITEAIAEEFRNESKARVTIGVSGTGGGFKKFCMGETDITGASRPIKASEIELCGKHGIRYQELSVAYDGLAVVVNPANTWVDHLTVDELKRMWAPEAQGTVKRWSQIRTGFPDDEIHLYGPGVDSGTYDYFTQAIVGREHASRGDYTSSEDDNVIVQGVATDKSALGFFGFAYYIENKGKLKLVPIDAGKGPIAPSTQTVADGTYAPLSRPIFIYISAKSVKKPAVKKFVEFYLAQAPRLSAAVGYIALPADGYAAARATLAKLEASP